MVTSLCFVAGWRGPNQGGDEDPNRHASCRLRDGVFRRRRRAWLRPLVTEDHGKANGGNGEVCRALYRCTRENGFFRLREWISGDLRRLFG